jgi:monoamine oxidase
MSVLFPAAKPKVERYVDWTTVPFIETSYAIPGVGTTISPNQIVPHAQRLYFAGEHTSPGFFGWPACRSERSPDGQRR